MPERESYFIDKRYGYEGRMITPIIGEHGHNACSNQCADTNGIFKAIEIEMVYPLEKRIHNISDVKQSQKAEKPLSTRNKVIAITSVLPHIVWKQQCA